MSVSLEDREETQQAFKRSLDTIKAHLLAHTDFALEVSDTSGGKMGLHVDPPAMYTLPHQMQALRSTGFAAAAVDEGDAEVLEEFHRSLQEPQAAIVRIQQAASVEAQDAATEMQQTRNTSAFAQKMEALKQKTKEDLCKSVDKVFNSAIYLGEEHPESQDHILNTTQKVVNFIDGVVTSIVNFVTSLINNIVAWVKEAVSKVKAFFTTSVDSIAHFFSSL